MPPRPMSCLATCLLFAAGLASGCVDKLVDETGGTTPGTSSDAPTPGTSQSPNPTANPGECPFLHPCDECPWMDGCPIPPMPEDSDVVFLLEDAYPVGGSVPVRIKNVGSVDYAFRTYYAACDIEYYVASGRQFLVPEGTHCDIVNEEAIKPGETKTLFTWDLDECVHDEWGCRESEDLAPGTYHLRATFHVVGDHNKKTDSGFDFELVRP